jgi:hypothetical protein
MKKKVSIEVLVEGRGGELVFVPLELPKEKIREMAASAKNPVLKHSIEKAAKEKKVKL